MISAREVLDQMMTEDELLDYVKETLTTFKWTWMHIPDRLYKMAAKAKRYDALPGAKGFPDIVAARGGEILFIELKTMEGSLDVEQIRWRDEIQQAELPGSRVCYYLWRPCDQSDGTIERVLR